jgi:hypothetical protein
MSELTLQLVAGRRTFHPGEELRGEAAWQVPRAPAAVEVRLCWFTGGLVTPEARCVERVRFDLPAASERRQFSFRLPEAPYSFQGALAALAWAVELIVLPSRSCTRVVFTMGPEGDALSLVHAPEEEDESPEDR